MTLVDRELLLVAAGALAGLVGTAGGITSLVLYPALLLAGVAPLQANVANIVALVACWPGSAVASRPELAGRGGWLRRWGVVAALGETAGSVLLLVTPAGVFGQVVPFLVVIGSLALRSSPHSSTAWNSCRRAWSTAASGIRAGRISRRCRPATARPSPGWPASFDARRGVRLHPPAGYGISAGESAWQ